MNEAERSLPERNDDQRACVKRYESMIDRNDRLFFDVEELEMIIDHYLERNEPRKAEHVLRFGTTLHPASIDLTFCEAVVMMGLGRLGKALELFDAVEKVDPSNEDIQLHKASIYSQQRNYRRAIEHFRKALELTDEGHDEIHLDLAFEHENLEEYDEAIQCLHNALAINHENEAVLHELAYCYDLAGADEASVSFFRAFTDEHPYSSVAWYNLGNVLAKLERYTESNEALDLSIAIDERFSSAYFSKARNLLINGHYQEAIDCYEETLPFDGPQSITFSFIGECYEKMERYDQALLHYNQAILIDPERVDAWIGRGVVKDALDRHVEALVDLEHAVRIGNENADAWYYYANALARAQRYETAFAAFERLHHLEPQYLEAWLDHSELLHRLKGPQAALEKLREGHQVHRLNARYQYRSVAYLFANGQVQQGLLELEQALTNDHVAHTALLEYMPDVAHMPQVMHLVDLYRK